MQPTIHGANCCCCFVSVTADNSFGRHFTSKIGQEDLDNGIGDDDEDDEDEEGDEGQDDADLENLLAGGNLSLNRFGQKRRLVNNSVGRSASSVFCDDSCKMSAATAAVCKYAKSVSSSKNAAMSTRICSRFFFSATPALRLSVVVLYAMLC